ncbi:MULTISPECIES: TlpA disulfide reductase family protein [Vibrio harveyi group]|uniref:TlpA disulfide reductase family protein n=1 Tax=Vibrio harveyi group TaxID=717610 RepID=UPI001F079A0C|nr:MULTISPECIES: TlpA disulfide reductase family protein [Vibrio harveyi group]MEA5376651.1 TlpA disulfide reductase family protein [Vibrio parahaemolyticus]UMM06725.1 TlpA family protein disulfide reductase [Vibrio campbellii]
MVAKRFSWSAMAVVVLIALISTGYGIISKPTTPAVEFTTLNGQRIDLADLRGKIILVNFWATSCGVCMAEMPDLVATYRQYRERGFEVIAVAMSYDDPEQVRKYVRKQGLPFSVVFDQDGRLAAEFEHASVTPTTFLIDKAGTRISKTVGIINYGKLRGFLESATTASDD